MPEVQPKVYRMTAQVGKEGGTVLGQRFKENGWSGKFYMSNNWGDLGRLSLASGTEAFFKIADDGNIAMATEDVTLDATATYELTLDLTGGNDHPVLSLVKK